MPDKKYYVNIPGTTEPSVLSEEDFNSKKDKLYSTYPDANVVEMQGYSPEEEVGDSDFFINIPGSSEPTQMSARDFAKKKDKLYAAYPDVQVSRMRRYNNAAPAQKPQGADDLERIYGRMEEIQKQLAETPDDEAPAADLRNMSDEDLVKAAAKSQTGNAKDRRALNRELEQLRAEREKNPIWQEYWKKTNTDIDESAKRVEQMRHDIDLSNPRSRAVSRLVGLSDRSGLGEMELRQDIESNPEYYRDQEALLAAKTFYGEAKKIATAPSKYGDESGLANYWEGVKKNAADAISVVALAKALNNVPLINAVQAIQEKEGKKVSLIDFASKKMDGADYLSNAQKEMIRAFVTRAQVESGRSDNLSKGYQAGKSAIESVGFMADFLVAGMAGDAAVPKAIGNLVKNTAEDSLARVGAESLYGLVKSAVMTPIMPSTYTNILNGITQLDENGGMDLSGKVILKAGADALIETASETIGSKPLDLLGWGVGKALPTDWLEKTTFGNWGKVLREGPVFGFMRQAGWNGFFEEMFEEVSGNAVRAWTGVDKDALKNFMQPDQLLITAASFAPMSIVGGIGSTARYGYVRNKYKTSLEDIQKRLTDLGFTPEQIGHITDLGRMSSPKDVADALKPAVDEMMKRGMAPSDIKALTDYAYYASSLNVYNAYESEKVQQQRNATQAELQGEYGDFWQGDDKSGRTVQRITLPDGRTGFVLNTDETGEMLVRLDEGGIAYANEKDVAPETMSLDSYLDSVILTGEQAQDAARMQEEAAAARQQFNNNLAQNADVPMGTPERQEVGKIVTQQDPNTGAVTPVRDANGNYIVATMNGQTAISENDLAAKWGIKLQPETRAQLDADAVAEYEASKKRVDAYNTIPRGSVVEANLEGLEESVPYQFTHAVYNDETGEVEIKVWDEENQREETLPESAFPDLQQAAAQYSAPQPAAQAPMAAEAPAVDNTPRDFRGNPLPLKDDGRVNQGELWEKDPEAWAAWNDQQRQDGGANTIAYIEGAKKDVEKDIATLQKAYADERDFDKRDAIEQEIARKQQRLSELDSLAKGYETRAAQAEEAAKAETEAATEQTEGQIPEETKSVQALQEQQAAAAEEQRRVPLRARAMEWAEKTGVPVELMETPEEVKDKDARDAIAAGERVTGWYDPNTGKVYIYVPNIRNEAEIDKTYIHEVISHKGLKEMLGVGFNTLLDHVWNDIMTEEKRKFFTDYVKKTNPNISGQALQRAAADEFIADLSEKIGLEAVSEEDLSNWEKFVNMIRNFFMQMITGGVKVTEEDLSDLLVASMARYKEIKEKGSAAALLRRGIEVGVSGGVQMNDSQANPVRFSIRGTVNGAGLDVVADDGNGNVAFETADGRRFDGNNPISAQDIKDLDNTVMSYMMADARKLGTITPEQEERIWQMYADQLNSFLQKGLAVNGGFEHLASMWEYEVANTVYKTVATNSDAQYAFSLDITRVCKKNEAVIKAISAMQNEVGYGITPGQIMDIYLQGIEEGYQVPCPVCYVFSRYINNGVSATIAINGQRKYGDQLVDPRTLTPEERKKKIDFWKKELKKQEKLNKENSKSIANAKADCASIIEEINELSRQITGGELKGKERQEAIDRIHALDRRYRAAFDVVTQAGLTQWIKQFAIHEVDSKWELWDDTFQGFHEQNALDLRLTADTIENYPAIQRLRKSRGAAGGKEIHFASNNDIGDIPMMLGASNLGKTQNFYKLAAMETNPKERKKLLAKASKRFADAHRYAQQQSLRGGQRMWSWSDNIERLAPDVAMNLMQMQLLGGALQSYSKQLEGVNLVASMNGYVNGSLMGYGRGFQQLGDEDIEVVDGREVLSHDITDTVTERTPEGSRERTRILAKKGSPVYTDSEMGKVTLLFDDVVGIDAYGRDRDGKHLLGLFDLNDTLDKAGNIIVGMNDTHVRAAMADGRIFFIIPWHASGNSVHIVQEMLAYLGVETDIKDYTDYTNVQEEKDIKEGETNEHLVNFWEAHKNEEDFDCGIEGGIPSGDGNGHLSEQQKHYRELRDAIFVGVDKRPVEEFPEMMEEIQNDQFLRQVYDKVRNTVDAQEMTNGDTKFIYPYEYWDETSTYDTADVNGARYLEYCRRLGYKPKFVGKLDGKPEKDFGNFADDKGYWKLLIDRRMYDVNGEYQDLDPTSTDNYDPKMADPEWTGQNFEITRVADDPGAVRVAEKVIAQENERFPGGIPVAKYDNTLAKAVENYKKVLAAEKAGEVKASVKKAAKQSLAKPKVKQETVDALKSVGIDLSDMVPASNNTQRTGATMFRTALEDGLTTDGYSYGDKAVLDGYGLEAADLSRRDDVVTLHRLVAKKRNQGAGTQFMTDLTEMADKNDWVLALTPTKDLGASSVERLKDFYKRFGFKENKGRNADLTVNESMIRQPEGNEIRFSIRGITGAQNANDQTALDNLAVATLMEDAGKDPVTIWKATGWQTGADGKWREEIPDAKLKEGAELKKTQKAGDILDAPELFQSYPQLADMEVELKNTASAGAYNEKDNKIVLDDEYNTDFVLSAEDQKRVSEQTMEYINGGTWKRRSDVAKYKKNLLEKAGKKVLSNEGIKSLLHELQHAIQHIEGFATGGNAAQMEKEYYDEARKADAEKANFAWLFSRRNSVRKLRLVGRESIVRQMERFDISKYTDRDKELFADLLTRLKNMPEEEFGKFVRGADAIAKNAKRAGELGYNNLAGEVEARNVERRSRVSPEARRKSPLSASEDVPRHEQIIRFRVSNEDQRIFISNAEKAVSDLKMDKATPEQWKKTLEKNGGLKAAEDKWLGLSTWLDGLDRKTVTKQEVLDYIAENQIQIEEQRYSEDVNLMRAATEDVRNTIGRGKELEELQAEVDELVASEEYQAINDDEEKDEWLLDQMKERYGDDFELGYFIDEEQKIDYALQPWDIDQDDINSRLNVRKIEPIRLGYTTEGLRNRQEIALTVPTIEPWNESDKTHFGDAGQGRAIAWARFGDTWTSKARDEAEKKYREADKAFRDYRDGIIAKYTEQKPNNGEAEKAYADFMRRFSDGHAPTREEQAELRRLEAARNAALPDRSKIREKATPEENAKVKELQLEANRLYQDWQYGRHPREKVLVIDEIQSKRHQEAREAGGYKDDSALKKAEKRRDAAKAEYDKYHASLLEKYGDFNGIHDNITPEENAESKRLYREFRDAQNVVTRNGFDPMEDEEYRRLREEQQAHENNPEFKRLMDEWQNEFKRGTELEDVEITVYVDENGKRDFDVYDGISTVRVMIDDNGVVTKSRRRRYEGKTLSELFGEDIAARLMSAKDTDVIENKQREAAQGRLMEIDEQLKPFQKRNFELIQKMQHRENELAEEFNETHKSRIPAAPFEKNWHELAMKRMLRYAAENGYEKVAWTTGAQQTERYATMITSKIGDIYASKDGDKYNVEVYDPNGTELTFNGLAGDSRTSGTYTEDELRQFFGREAAETIIASVDAKQKENDIEALERQYRENPTRENLHAWRDASTAKVDGEDLFRGEGMKGFYDDILPRFMNKYGKKWGVKVEDIFLPALGEENRGLTMHSVPVTEEMKDSVMQGQTMFRVAMEEYDKESQELFDAAKERFGTTRDLREAGYVLPDGSMLDFSGRHQASGDTSYLNGERTVDHRDIEDLNFERDLNTPSGRNTSMPDFIERGAIRIHMPGMINLAVKPTPEQASVLERLINADNHYVTVDFGNGYSTEHSAEYDNARPVRIINDINRYFDEGYRPSGNTMFRITPEQDAEYMEAVNAGDMDAAQEMVREAAAAAMPNTKVVDKDGKPMVVYHGTPDMGFTVFAQPGEGFQGLIWMTDQKRYAEVYAEEYDGEGYPNEGAGVYSLFANIENPLDMGYIEDVVGSDSWNNLAEKLGMTPEELFNRLKRLDNFTYEDAQRRMMYIYDYTRDAEFANLLKEKGFDGAFALEEGINKTPTYAAVDPSQVKSADPVERDDQGNVIPLSERFNEGNDDIRFRVGSDNINAGLNALEKLANGEEVVRDAMSRPDLSQYGADANVAFYWGETGDPSRNYKKGYGIAHMGAKHGPESIFRALDIIDHGEIERYVEGNKTVVLTDGEYEALLALTRSGRRETWLFNGWEKKENAGETSEVSTQSGSTQTNPTFSREDLGAAVSEYKDRINSENTNSSEEISISDEPMTATAPEVEESAVRFRKVEDPLKIAELEAGEKIPGYRTVVLNPDGSMASPMAGELGVAKAKKSEDRRVKTSSFTENAWNEAEENPDLADENGKIKLIKTDNAKRGLVDVDEVDYNPYNHLRLSPVNLQFKDAWKRPDLIYIKSEVPKSEAVDLRGIKDPAEKDRLSPYHAEKAVLPVGIHDWSGGGELLLSRWDKPVGQVEWEEVADAWANDEKVKEGVQFDRVPPQILDMLVERGIDVLPPSKGKDKNEAYKAWKAGDKEAYEAWRDTGKAPKKTARVTRFRVAYHGSPADFSEFEEGHYREGVGSFHRPGFYFASDEKSARTYAYDRGNGAFLYEVELPDDNGSNYIHVFSSIPKSKRRELAEKIRQTFPEKDIDVEKRIVNRNILGEDLLGMFTNDELQQLGFVGIEGPMYLATMPQKQYVIFNAKDIKMKGKTNVATGEGIRFRTADDLVKRVQDYGLRGILDEDAAKAFWADAYAVMPEDARKEIVDNAFSADADKQDLNIRREVRKYIAALAKKGYAEDESGLLRYLADKLKEELGEDLDENTLRYLIWRSANRYNSGIILNVAEDIALRRQLGVGEFSGDRFPSEAEQAVSEAENRIDSAEDEREASRRATRSVVRKTPYAALNAAMSGQRKYDQETVNSIVALAKDMIKKGDIDKVSAREMARLMTIIKDANGRRPATVKASALQLLDFMVDHTIGKEKELLEKMLKVRTAKVREPGVDTIAKLDLRTQNIINKFRDNYKLSKEEIDKAIEALEEKLDDRRFSETSLEDMRSKLEGLQLAKQYITEITAKEAEIKEVHDMMEYSKSEFDGLTTEEKRQLRTARNEEVAADYEMIRSKKIEQVEAYRRLRGDLAKAINEGADRAQTFLEAERERVEQIHHWANADMQGTETTVSKEDPKKTRWELLKNGFGVLALPLANTEQLLRMLGRKSVNGFGYLYNHFAIGIQKASDNMKLGVDAAYDKVNAKINEIFEDNDIKTLHDLFIRVGKLPKVQYTFRDASGNVLTRELTVGNLLYIYAANKMTDGRMKLRRMNISEEDVEAIKKALDPKLIKFVDWVQEDLLERLRDKYNETHQRMFGTSMAAIENYFPIRIAGGDIHQEVDLGQMSKEDMASVLTGAIIKRTINDKMLDIENADFFAVLADHIDEMEEWSAYAEIRRDVNTLLSYDRFRNQVTNLKTIYGKGEDLWKLVKRTMGVGVEMFRPQKPKADEFVLNAAKGVSAAKVNFRVYTALKQILSLPAFIADASPELLVKSLATAPESWKWAMENLPSFKKRWESGAMGNEKLEKNDSDLAFWDTKLGQFILKDGMLPNRFVDALTVSIGAKAMYDTKKRQYIREGFSEEKADEKAKIDAELLFNATQQSSEGLFLSAVQKDRSVLSNVISVFRNSSMGYQRQVHQAFRTIGRRRRKGYKEESIAFTTKQLVREGLTEEQAKKAAEARYKRSGFQAAVRLATFGFMLEFFWNIASHAPYLLFGDDPDEKKAMLLEDLRRAYMGGLVEGLAGGQAISQVLYNIRVGASMYGQSYLELPLVADFRNILSELHTDKVRAANDLINLAVQIGLGSNPQTLSDAIMAIYDACNADEKMTKEVLICIMRIMQVPQSQIDQFMIDEIGMTAADAQKLSYEEIAKRYSEYKTRRNAGVASPLYGLSEGLRENREKASQKTFKKKYNERKKLKEEE